MTNIHSLIRKAQALHDEIEALADSLPMGSTAEDAQAAAWEMVDRLRAAKAEAEEFDNEAYERARAADLRLSTSLEAF